MTLYALAAVFSFFTCALTEGLLIAKPSDGLQEEAGPLQLDWNATRRFTLSIQNTLVAAVPQVIQQAERSAEAEAAVHALEALLRACSPVWHNQLVS